jgi:gliding motility-associated-like protein
MVTLNNSCGSVTSDTVSLWFVGGIPTVTGSALKNPLCIGQSTTLSGMGALNYIWSDSLFNGVGFFPLVSSNYTVVGFGLGGCMDTAHVQVTVFPVPTVSGMATINPICQGQPTTLSGFGANNYLWNSSLSNGIGFSPMVTSIYTVVGIGLGGCADTASVQVTVYSAPTVTGMAIINPVCQGHTTTLAGSGAVNYYWSNGAMDKVAFVPTASQWYTVTGTGMGGCMDTSSVWLEVDPSLKLLNFSDTSISCGTQYTLNIGTGYRHYLWQDSSTTSMFTIKGPGIYSISISNACGLAADTFIVSNHKLIMPNVFTPNHDGKNDEMVLGNYYSGGHLIISDRWGHTVYQSNNYLNNWDAELVPDGMYFYNFNSDCETLKGWVEIIR